MFIVKVQKPLYSTEKNPGYLTYANIARQHKYRARLLYDLPVHALEALQDKPKAYFYADWSAGRDNWVLKSQAPKQDW